MKQLLRIILCLSFIFAPALGISQELISLDQDELKGIYHDLLTKDAPWPKADLVLNNFKSKPETVKVPFGQLEFNTITNSSTKVLGSQTRSIIVSVDGKAYAKIKMRGTMQLFGPVVVLKRNIPRHSVITRPDLSIIRRDITMLSQDIITTPNDAINHELKTSLQAGSYIYKRNLKLRTLVNRGDLVTIQAKSKAIQVSATGEARSHGIKGQIIKVKNLSSRKIITAVVVDEGLVEVTF